MLLARISGLLRESKYGNLSETMQLIWAGTVLHPPATPLYHGSTTFKYWTTSLSFAIHHWMRIYF